MGNSALDLGLGGPAEPLPTGVTTYIDEILKNVRTKKNAAKTSGRRPLVRIEQSGDGADDPWKPMKNVLTDISTNEFLTSDVMFNFLHLIFQSFSTMLEKYSAMRELDPSSIRFVYKGGNVLRFIAQRTLQQMPGEIALTLEKEYGKFFKKSDADFSIYISPDLPDYDTIFDEVTLLAAYTLDYIRTYFAQDTDRYLTVSRYNSRYLRQMLERYLPPLRQEASDIGIEVAELALSTISTAQEGAAAAEDGSSSYRSSPNNPLDMYITRRPQRRRRSGAAPAGAPAGGGDNDKPEESTVIFPLELMYGNEERMPFYITVNDTLEFQSSSGKTIKFNLVRMKVNFNTLVAERTAGGTGEFTTKKLSGELIDVSIPHRKDGEVNHVFGDISGTFQNYVVVDDKKENELEIQSYTLEYMIHDLVRILFKDYNFPWEDAKYVKRVKRLFFLYFVQVLNAHKSIDATRSMLDGMRRCLSSVRAGQTVRRKVAKDLASSCDGLSGGDFGLYNFVTVLYPAMVAKRGDLQHMSRFDEVVSDQVDIMNKVLHQIHQFQRQPDLVDTTATAQPFTLSGGAAAAGSRGLVAQLRASLRELLQGERASLVHAHLADQVNRQDSHQLRQLVRSLHSEAKQRISAVDAPGRISVLWVSPFHRTPLYWTEEERPEYVDPHAVAYIFRVLCATTRRHGLVVEGVRDLGQRQTHCFSTKQPLHTIPTPP